MRLSSGTVRRRRLLLVDPDAVFRAGLEEPLDAALWAVLSYSSAGAALAWLEANPAQTVDAIWCESDLRGESGVELVERVRVLRPGLAAVIVTASTLPEPQLASVFVFSKKETAAAVRWLTVLEPEADAVPFV